MTPHAEEIKSAVWSICWMFLIVYSSVLSSGCTRRPNEVAGLIAKLSDESPSVRKSAAQSLGRVETDAKAAARSLADLFLKEQIPEVREAVAEALGSLSEGASESVPALIAGLDSEEPVEIRRAAVNALGQLGPRAIRAEGRLGSMLTKDEDPNVRVGAAQALGRIGSSARDAVPMLTEALADKDKADKDKNVRAACSKALREIGLKSPAVIEALVKSLSDKELLVGTESAMALAKLGELELLIKAATAEELRGRVCAVTGLGEVEGGPRRVIDTLKAALGDESRDVREAATKSLGKIGPEAEDAIQALCLTIKDKVNNDKAVRASAAEALGSIGPNEESLDAVSGALTEGLTDITALVRVSSLTALHLMAKREKLGDTRPLVVITDIRPLVHAITDGNNGVRIIAAQMLGELQRDRQIAMQMLVYALRDDDEKVRNTSASSLVLLSKAIVKSKSTEFIDDLVAAHTALVNHQDSAVRRQADELHTSINKLLQARQPGIFEEIRSLAGNHPFVSATCTTYLVLLLAWVPLMINPIWLLKVNDLLMFRFKLNELPDWISLPFRVFLFADFFLYRPRVLDAWVARHILKARQRFNNQIDTVKNRSVHIAVPVKLNQSDVILTGERLRSAFEEKQTCVLIWGEGGSGKTSLACQIGNWSMSTDERERICKHYALPILIEQELEFEAAPGTHLTEAIRGRLEFLVGEKVTAQLVEHLLKHKRLIVIIDRFSQMSDVTRGRITPGLPNFNASGLVVTSRTQAQLDGAVRTTINTRRISSRALTSFVDDYLKALKKRNLFEDPEYLDTCKRLSSIVGERDVTVLLAKLYLEQVVARKDGRRKGELPENIPDLMLSYLSELNCGKREDEPDDSVVHRVAKAIAWECVKDQLRPSAVAIKRLSAAAAKVIDETGKTTSILNYLDVRLRLIRKSEPARDRSLFTLDPLAEYLAGLFLVEEFGASEVAWSDFLKDAERQPGASVRGFVLALRDCCLARGAESGTPEFVAPELGRLAGLGQKHAAN